ncbi:hypothetical protein EDD29_3303 [Actinocorallia herbida]|uniref:Uncharacterized protein n=1 Tax=Actinocorallia herbida TaxID=58109 RepID=A0A3N1CWW5_9ACTN|nr:hypothetical protein [Actinocorallia herbida]ROO85754.1 hypothetical protein EDD29_3303 [Actinocorallia herbida]
MTVAFTASLDTADAETVAEILSTWLDLDLRVRTRLFGWEIHHDDAAIELYAHEALGSSTPLTLLSGTARLDFDRAHPLFESLHTRCTAGGIPHDLEYEEEDAASDDRVRILTHR